MKQNFDPAYMADLALGSDGFTQSRTLGLLPRTVGFALMTPMP